MIETWNSFYKGFLPEGISLDKLASIIQENLTFFSDTHSSIKEEKTKNNQLRIVELLSPKRVSIGLEGFHTLTEEFKKLGFNPIAFNGGDFNLSTSREYEKEITDSILNNNTNLNFIGEIHLRPGNGIPYNHFKGKDRIIIYQDPQNLENSHLKGLIPGIYELKGKEIFPNYLKSRIFLIKEGLR